MNAHSFLRSLAIVSLAASGLSATGPARASDSRQPSVDPTIPVIAAGSAYRQTNLISDWPGLAPILDPLLVNPWGMTESATSPFWVSNAGTSTSTLYRGDVNGSPFFRSSGLTFITIPGGLPTGIVFNGSTDFAVTNGNTAPARFIFSSLTQNIDGWSGDVPAPGSTTAQKVVNLPGHVYTGLAIGNNGSANFLYAADFVNGRIDVFDKNYVLQPSQNFPFADPTIPTTAGNTFHPFNIQTLGGSLYVTYAKFDPLTGKDIEGVGNGFVRRFNLNGVRDLTFGINNGALNSPWGLAIAPAPAPAFGIFSGALLVGNFGEGNPSIHAYNPTTGAFLGTLQDESGNGIVIDELWALSFGNGGANGGGDVNTLYFTAGIGEEGHGLLGSLKATTASATSLIQFSTSAYTVSEGTGHIDVTVTRDGDSSGTAIVNYATFDENEPGHASQKSDYELAVGKVTFEPGETSKTFRILIVDDLFVEGNETIDLFLSNSFGPGLGLGSPSHAEVTITENDAVAPTTNPIDDTHFFIRQLYIDFLGREPEDGPFNFLLDQINACGTNAACRDERRVNAATAFFTSLEFQQTAYHIYLVNKAAFKNAAPGAGTTNLPVLYGDLMRDLQLLNQGVPFGQPGWDGVLLQNHLAYFTEIVFRPAFRGLYPTTQTPAQFVDTLYLNAGVTPSPAERQAAIDFFGGAGDTANIAARTRALQKVIQNTTFVANEFNRAFVFFEFAGFYRRHPDQGAFDTQVNALDAANGDFRAAGMIKKFLDNAEYRQRFGAGAAPAGAGPSPTPGSQSLNISTRGRVAGGENVLIAGFIINGSGSKNVVLRAIGPSLTSSGISDGLADPFLELRTANGTSLASNDNWKTFQGTIPPNLAPTDDRESAIAISLAPGAYTATVSGKGPATGVALAEVYDVDTQPSTSALANISTRGNVQTQNNVLIGGFQLGGNSTGSLILARGGGPSLQNFGITSPLANPTIEFHNANGITLSENDNWRDTQEIEVLYLGLPPADRLESAIVATRPAGPTTVIVQGKNGTTGVGLVEIFNFR